MGSTITKLVFRPPKPTPIKNDRFFYIEVPPETSFFACSPAETAGCSMMPTNLDNQISNTGPENGAHRIPAFFLLRRNAKLTLLYSHGNAEDLGMMYRRMKDLARVLEVNIMCYDYSGYGLSRPKCQPSEKLCYRNIDAAYNYLIDVMKIPPASIILYGRSLGSGPSCYLAKKTADAGESVAGLVLHSPFLSIYRIVLDVKSGFVGDMFQSYRRAKSVKCPVFLIHGENDQVVPFWHSNELLRSFQPQHRAMPFFVKGLGHNNIEVKKRQEYVRRISFFFDSCMMNGRTVPVNERYMPDVNVHESGHFINRTWLKHGREIVKHALEANDTNNDANGNQQPRQKQELKSFSPILPQHQINTNSVAIVRTNTGDLLAKLINDEAEKNANDSEDKNAAKFLRTMESWDTDGTDVKNCSFDSHVALKIGGSQIGFNNIVDNMRKLNKKELDHSALTSAHVKKGLPDRENQDDYAPLDNITNQL